MRTRQNRLGTLATSFVLSGLVASAATPKIPTFFARHDYLESVGAFVAVADTNGDGIPDLISVSGGTQVFFGNGDGTFREGPASSTGMTLGPFAVAADLNGDGKVDLVLSGGLHGGEPPLGIGVSYGDGKGAFGEVFFYPAGDEMDLGNPELGDFNGDGIMDVAVVGDRGLWLFTGKGRGAFNPGVLVAPLAASGGGFLAAADFNGDGNLDLVATMPFGGPDGIGNGSVVLFGNGDGTFQPPVAIADPAQATATAAGPLTKGGSPGIVLWDGNAYLYSYDGNGGFLGPQIVDLPSQGFQSITIGDVNGDGFPDLVSSTGNIVLGTASGTFRKPIAYPVDTAYGSHNVVLADLRKNGLTDIVTEAATGLSVLLSLGKGNLPRFEDGEPTLLTGGSSCGVTADFNGDGKPDLAVNTQQGVTIWLGTGTAKSPFARGSSIPVADTGCVVAGDLNGDGIPDLLVPVNGAPNALLSYLGNGDGTFRLAATTPTPNSGGSVVLADFNRDGKLDFATSGNLLAFGNGDGTFQTPAPFIADPQLGGYSSIATGDVNNDGWPDLVMTNGSNLSGTLYVGLNNQQGGFNSVPNTYIGLTDDAILADSNGDGNLDLVVQGVSEGGASILIGDGTGGFTLRAEIANPLIFPGLNLVADLNGDGIPDIVELAGETLTIFLGKGGVAYASGLYIGTGSVPSGLLAANLHGQAAGLPDIIVPDALLGVMVLLNQTR